MSTMKRIHLSFYRLSMAAMFCSLLLTAQSVHALKTDRDQPADIQADDTEIDFKKGTRTFINNVIAVQGTLRLKSDKLIAVYNDGELQKATMWGNLARFKQRPDGKPDDVQGWAKKIILDQQANTLTLVGKASLQQGLQTARGDTIVYNMATDTLKVNSGRFGDGGQNGRVRPDKKIEDPFADDDLPPPPQPSSSSAAKVENANDDSKNKEDDKNKTTAAEPRVAPTTSGRSRLILQPRKKPKEVESDADDNDGDSDDADDEEADTKEDGDS